MPEIAHKASKGKFRIIGINTIDPHEWLVGEYTRLWKAK